MNVNNIIRSTWSQSAFIFIFFFSYYFLCISKNFTEVDGADRCFGVYHSTPPQIHGNNHMFYPLNIYLWNQALSAVINTPVDALEFGKRSQIMNITAMSATMTLFYALAKNISALSHIAALATLGLGLSKAYILHGTNSSEPVVALLWSTLTIALLAWDLCNKKKQSYIIFLAGIFLALAMATYQSMVLIGVGCLVLSCFRREVSDWKTCIKSGLIFLSGCFFGALIFFGSAYYYDGLLNPIDMVKRFFHLDGGSDVYGGFSFSKTTNLLMGFIHNQFLNLHWAGYRDYLKTNLWSYWTPWITCAGIIGIIFLLVVSKGFFQSNKNSKRIQISITLGLLVCLIGPLGWDPTYDKLWLQPLMLIWLTVLYSWKNQKKLGKFIIYTTIVLTVLPNFFWGYFRNPKEYRFVQPALELIETLKPNDILVIDWNPISLMAVSLGVKNEVFFIISYAHSNPANVVEKLNIFFKKAEKNGGKLVFFGILNQPRETWDPFLGKRCGLPYEALDSFRKSSKCIGVFSEGTAILEVFEIDFLSFPIP
jgi:hypothetical protein